MVRSRETVDRVLMICTPGVTTRQVARLTGIPESTIGHWRRGDRRSNQHRARSTTACPRCAGTSLDSSYAYLLGSYLGDGHITIGRRGVQALSLYCSNDWPGIMDDVEAAMRAVLPSSVCRVRRTGCIAVKSYSKHWTCLLPQHGPGRKHMRQIVLEPWQEEIVNQSTGEFLRGLFHSDGCRFTNWTSRSVGGVSKRYEYPRYLFSNESTDILGLCAAALDRLGIAHRRPRANLISVARRQAVAALDQFVGPKS